MPFVELLPATKGNDIGTGCRISVGKKGGMRISLASPALEALGSPDDEARFKVLIDRDPALPRLRILSAKDGRFKVAANALSEIWRYLNISQQASLPTTPLPSTMATWEALEDGAVGIDIDLPPQFATRSTVQPVGRPSTSTGPRPSPVTVAGSVR